MRKSNHLLAIISGLLLALAMPKPGLWPFAWVALVPLLVAIRGARLRTAFVYGFITGAVYSGIILFWITLFGYLPWVAAALVLGGLPIALFAVIACRIMPQRIGWWGYIAVAAAWTAMQWTRSLGPLGFPWGSFAHIHANILSLVQITSITGAWGIDFLVCLFNVAAIGMLQQNGRARWAPISAACLLIIACIAWGSGVIKTERAPAKDVSVAIIQGNVSQDVDCTPDYLSYALGVYEPLSRAAAQSKPGFIVWPETTLPTAISDIVWGAVITELARETNTNFIVGAYDAPNESKGLNYNAAHFYDRAGKKLGVYHKVHLVPYGEYVPLRDHMPFLRRYGIREKDVLPGDSHTPIDTEIGKVGVSICFESLFSQISRIETRNGAVALFILTNDGWFGRSQAARQHLMMAKLRAVENRRYIVRAAATGISAVIDPYGKTISELGIFRRGVVKAHIKPLRVMTPYTRLGDVFAYACTLIAAITYFRTVCRVKS